MKRKGSLGPWGLVFVLVLLLVAMVDPMRGAALALVVIATERIANG